jgi:hypothetical protein
MNIFQRVPEMSLDLVRRTRLAPSIRYDGCRYEAVDEGEVMVSMEDVMNPRSETMNFWSTCDGVVSSEDRRTWSPNPVNTKSQATHTTDIYATNINQTVPI